MLKDKDVTLNITPHISVCKNYSKNVHLFIIVIIRVENEASGPPLLRSLDSLTGTNRNNQLLNVSIVCRTLKKMKEETEPLTDKKKFVSVLKI